MSNYPTIQQVNDAERLQICEWWRFLPSPRNESEVVIMNRIAERFKEVGGFTPEISKAIGW